MRDEIINGFYCEGYGKLRWCPCDDFGFGVISVVLMLCCLFWFWVGVIKTNSID